MDKDGLAPEFKPVPIEIFRFHFLFLFDGVNTTTTTENCAQDILSCEASWPWPLAWRRRQCDGPDQSTRQLSYLATSINTLNTLDY